MDNDHSTPHTPAKKRKKTGGGGPRAPQPAGPRGGWSRPMVRHVISRPGAVGALRDGGPAEQVPGAATVYRDGSRGHVAAGAAAAAVDGGRGASGGRAVTASFVAQEPSHYHKNWSWVYVQRRAKKNYRQLASLHPRQGATHFTLYSQCTQGTNPHDATPHPNLCGRLRLGGLVSWSGGDRHRLGASSRRQAGRARRSKVCGRGPR